MDRLMFKGVFITGTDTDVGKTMVSRALLSYFNDAGLKVLGVKPICCGVRDDVKQLQAENRAAGFFFSDDEVNPVFLTEPAAPISVEGVLPDVAGLSDQLARLTDAPLLVEGAGGWAVPVTPQWGMDDLAVMQQLPVIMVVSNKLGALNHSILTARAIKSAGLPLLGYILNTVEQTDYAHAQRTNRAVLDEVLDCPCIAEIPLGGGDFSSNALRCALEMPHLLDLPLQFQISNS